MMTTQQLQGLGRDLLAPLRWHEFWIGIIAGAVFGTALFEVLAYFVCK